MFFQPFMIFFAFVLLFVLLVAFGLIQFGVFSWAFSRIGIAPEYLFSLLFFCIIGSMINIPLKRVRIERDDIDEWNVSFFGMRFQPPRFSQPNEMVLAVNVGGAIIPSLLSIYLIMQTPHTLRTLMALAAVTFVVYRIARPVQGIGIAIPMFIPPIVAAVAAMIFNYHWAAPTAYAAGTLGTLLGADVLHLDKLKGLRAPVASIGGAGTFDGIFLTGILAVLLSPGS